MVIIAAAGRVLLKARRKDQSESAGYQRGMCANNKLVMTPGYVLHPANPVLRRE